MYQLDPAAFGAPLREQLDGLLDQHRSMLDDALDGMTEDEARARLVPSKTTLLALVKHATFVEQVWFDHAVTGRSRAEIGIADTVDPSFEPDDADTIASIKEAHRRACAQSRAAVAGLGLDDVMPGNRGVPQPLRWIYLHTLRELAQHCGHADILREQLLARRADDARPDSTAS